MSNHAVLPPSSAERWLNCPGSRALSEGCPDSDSEASRYGTFAHDIAARALTEDRPASDYIGEIDGEFTVDEQMAEQIQVYIDVVDDLAFVADKVLIEQKVVYSDDNWGTSDAVIVTGATLDIVDLKFGLVYVSADANTQLMDYACAALKSLELPRAIQKVRLHIVQPRHYDADDVHRTYETTIGALGRWEATVLAPGIAAAFDSKARLQPGDHCKYCPAQMKCMAYQDAALVAAQEVFTDGDLTSAAKTPQAPSTLTPERLKVAYDAIPLLKEWIKSIEEFAHNEAKVGRLISGYKLVGAIGNRKWTSESDAEKKLRKSGIEPFVERLISPNQAQQALGNKKAHKAFIDDLCIRPALGDKLVPVSDRRPSISSGDVFDTVETEK